MILTHGANSLESGGPDDMADFYLLEYIKLTGDNVSDDPRFEIPIEILQGDVMSMTFLLSADLPNNVVVNGWFTKGNSKHQEFFLQRSYDGISFETDMNNLAYQDFGTSATLGKKYRLEKSAGNFILYDYESGTSTSYSKNNGTWVNQTQLNLFGSSSWPGMSSKLQFYNFSITRAGELIHNFLPVLNRTNSNCGVYDSIDGKAYYPLNQSLWSAGQLL